MARLTARKRALNTLYEADEKGQSILSLLDERLVHPGAQTPLPEYAVELVRGVAEHLTHVDALLNAHSATWQVSRMPVVDRNIMRLATWEIVYNDEVPGKVAIDEALQLAKKLSDSDAPAFIHGVLSSILTDPETAPEPEPAPEPVAEKPAEAEETVPVVDVTTVPAVDAETLPADEVASAPAESTDAPDLADISLADLAGETVEESDAADAPDVHETTEN